MSPERIFSVCGMLATVGWLLLVFLPRRRWTARLVCPVVIPLAIAVVYLWLVATTFGRTPVAEFGRVRSIIAAASLRKLSPFRRRPGATA